ncbi:GDP-mannose pyrophosphorylase A [Arctopsyche grandis]|uniref:GDP-mannose pyrophosphorylase A n=1 Tax=Arctopsyche grandis TaxID=121162 RepID=UPI00406D885E
MLKAVILIGGPNKGTRFRPLSLDVPKPLFPVAGLPLIQHHIEACVQLRECREILLIGSYQAAQLQHFITDMQKEYNIVIRYLQEFTALGTAGGMYHFRDQIRAGGPAAFFVLNGDVCADFPLKQLYDFHVERGPQALVTIMSTEATRQQSLNYGCMVISRPQFTVDHYVEKPNSYISSVINCGVYVCSMDIFQVMAGVFNRKQNDIYSNGCNGLERDDGYIAWEQEILAPLAGTNKLFAMQITNWWSQVKTAGSAIFANRHYLGLYRTNKPERLAPLSNENGDSCTIMPDVYIHSTARVHKTAVIGPNVSIGPGVVVAEGVRLKESIVLANASINQHALVMHSIIGQDSVVGAWSRVEGTPSDPDPNKPFAKMDNPSLFNTDGRLNPSITILGCNVIVPSEIIVLNSIVLPHKNLSRSFKHEIIL